MAIADLIEAVERGEWPAQMMNPIEASEHLDLAEDAYHGNLNAAVVLLEAVLPGWRWSLYSDGFAVIFQDHYTKTTSSGATPARALLLAILKALAAKEGEV